MHAGAPGDVCAEPVHRGTECRAIRIRCRTVRVACRAQAQSLDLVRVSAAAGLGSSPIADFYGIEDLREAEAYLRDPVLRSRMLLAASVVQDQLLAQISLASLMGADIDVIKLVSSMTLFAGVARRIEEGEAADECRRIAAAAEAILDAAAREGHARCAFTERRLVGEGFGP